MSSSAIPAIGLVRCRFRLPLYFNFWSMVTSRLFSEKKGAFLLFINLFTNLFTTEKPGAGNP